MKIKLLILFCALVFNTKAQPDEETKTVFGNKNLKMGYFVNPYCQFGEIAGSTAVLPGIGAGIIINNKLTLGLTYKFIVNENTPVGETDSTLYLDQKFFGLKCEYSVFPEKAVHFNLQLETGIGHTELDLKDSYEFGDAPSSDVSFAYLEPGVALEINIWKYIKLNLAANYRIVSDVSFRSLSEKNFMGINGSVGLKIGIF